MEERPTGAAHATDAELVRDARQGDTAAFEALTARHFPMVYALAFARLGAREAAGELAQEVFLLAFLHLGALADPARYAAWLGRIARNEAGMWRRRSQSASRLVRLVPLDDLPAEPAAPASQEARTALEADEETRALHEALFRLPEDLREVVLLHYFEDLSKAEIAERLEVHPATVGRQIEKAVKAMKRTLEPILRRAAPAFRHSGKAAARTTLLVAAVAAMSAPAKAALLAEAGVSVASLAAATQTVAIATSWQTISSGGFLMSAKTQFTAVLILLALLAGGAYYQISRTTAAPKDLLAATGALRSTNPTVPTSATATLSASPDDIGPILQAYGAAVAGIRSYAVDFTLKPTRTVPSSDPRAIDYSEVFSSIGSDGKTFQQRSTFNMDGTRRPADCEVQIWNGESQYVIRTPHPGGKPEMNVLSVQPLLPRFGPLCVYQYFPGISPPLSYSEIYMAMDLTAPVTEEILAGEPAYVLRGNFSIGKDATKRVVAKKGKTFRIDTWISKKHFLPLQHVIDSGEGDVWTICNVEYQQVENLYFPVKADYVGRKAAYTLHYLANNGSLKMNQEVPAEVFVPNIKPGTFVWDYINRSEYIHLPPEDINSGAPVGIPSSTK